MVLPNLRDPSVVFRAVIVVLSAISTILLIAGTANDEYLDTPILIIGCQKHKTPSKSAYGGTVPSFSTRLPFKEMGTLSIAILAITSILCVLQAVVTALNALVLLRGMNGKGALISSSVLTLLLLVVIVMVNVNFSPPYMASVAAASVRRGKRSTAEKLVSWGSSYSLLSATFAFAVINQILLILIHRLGGGSTLGSLKDKIVSTVRDIPMLLRIATTLLSSILLLVMVLGVAQDEYVTDPYGGSCGTRFVCGLPVDTFDAPSTYYLAIAIIAITALVCLLLVASVVLGMMQLAKDKPLARPLIVLSGLSTVLLLVSIVLACVNFASTESKPNAIYGISKESKWGSTFKSVAASFALGIVNTALHVLGMVLAKKGGGGGPSFSKFTSNSSMPSSGQPSSGGVPKQPSSN